MDAGPRPRSGNRPAFTLVELTVVLIILAVMGVVAVPAFRRFVEPDDLTVAIQRVDALFKIARDSAVNSATPVTVWIDSATSNIWLVSALEDTAAIDSLREKRAGELAITPGEPMPLPSSVHIELTKARARFRFGTSGGVFADSLVLRTVSDSLLITLNPWTGDVVH
jgi:prepilin-type N-terminal cleavage/methylation domain-containing protein